MREQNVEFKVNGQPGAGYLVRPDSEAPARGVVVIQEWWGVDAHVKDVTTRFAKQGYAALAPDLYHGRTIPVSEPDEAQKALMQLDFQRAIKEVVGAVSYLVSQPFVSPKKVGVIGFCMGGGLALRTATQSADVGAVAAFYGGGSPDASAFAHNHAAILNIIGEHDADVAKSIRALDAGLKAYQFPHEVASYPEGHHAFFNDTRPQIYNASAAQDAWKRSLDWFQKYLN
jgi:carboxymethylenebutenolidase